MDIPKMSGFSAPGVKGRLWHSMGPRYSPSSATCYDPDEIEKVAEALAADVAECQTCQAYPPGSFAPQHSTSYVAVDKKSARTYHCRSFSRWYNPDTGKMEGHAHCTCDGCF